MKEEHCNTEEYGFMGDKDISEILNPYCGDGLVVRPMSQRSDRDGPDYIQNGGYRANPERLDELKGWIGKVD